MLPQPIKLTRSGRQVLATSCPEGGRERIETMGWQGGKLHGGDLNCVGSRADHGGPLALRRRLAPGLPFGAVKPYEPQQ
jgi:hypothetical protein